MEGIIAVKPSFFGILQTGLRAGCQPRYGDICILLFLIPNAAALSHLSSTNKWWPMYDDGIK